MKALNKKGSNSYTTHSTISCGNCWGHQKYQDGFVDITLDVNRGRKDNFISRFVKKYINSGK